MRSGATECKLALKHENDVALGTSFDFFFAGFRSYLTHSAFADHFINRCPVLTGLFRSRRQGFTPVSPVSFILDFWLRSPLACCPLPVPGRFKVILLSRVHSATLSGVDGVCVEVEVRISSQLPRIDIVGLPETAVRESAARVRAAISAIGEKFPDRRITVNLAPAGLKKSGAGLDLPIAIGILAAAGAIEHGALEHAAFMGELALDGRLRPVRGTLALALASRDEGCTSAFVAEENAREASVAPGIAIHGAKHLELILAHLRGASAIEVHTPPPFVEDQPTSVHCLSDVRGQEGAKRALEVAAAGGHALLLCGPPGSGKTMLARRLPGILPPMQIDEALDATRIHGAAQQLSAEHPMIRQRPFRAPHHSASSAGLMGGGNPPMPGEVSLAHRGVLFLDELPEFNRRSLESLRAVLEGHSVRLARAGFSCVFPAHFQLIAAANPCPCGWYQSGVRDCRCDDTTIARYQQRVSGPLLDRIDLHVNVPAQAWRDLEQPSSGPTSATLRERVVRARELQHRRGVRSNAEIPDAQLDQYVKPTPEANTLLGRAVDGFGLSARAARRVLRTARTIADLAETTHVEASAIAEALTTRTESQNRPIS